MCFIWVVSKVLFLSIILPEQVGIFLSVVMCNDEYVCLKAAYFQRLVSHKTLCSKTPSPLATKHDFNNSCVSAFPPMQQNIPSKSNKGIHWELNLYIVAFCSVCFLACYAINLLPFHFQEMMFLLQSRKQQEEFLNKFLGLEEATNILYIFNLLVLPKGSLLRLWGGGGEEERQHLLSSRGTKLCSEHFM